MKLAYTKPSRIKSILKKIFNLIGLEAEFTKKGEKSIALFDRYDLEYYFEKNEEIRLYYEGLNKAQVEFSDNVSKQFRFYSV